jgi:hypothetical protein
MNQILDLNHVQVKMFKQQYVLDYPLVPRYGFQ